MITADQFIGKTLIATTSISSITTADRIRHGLRPIGTVLPAINFYKLSGNNTILSSEVYSINCRATDITTAMRLSKLVKTIFCGSNNLGTYGSDSVSGVNVFNASKISLNQEHGAILESDGSIWNVPIDILIVY